MSIDINTLSVILKAAALKAKSDADEWGYDTDAFHDVATPDAVIELVEALEAAESKLALSNSVLDKIKSTSSHVDMSEGAIIPESLDAWGRPVPQFLPYDFSGNPGASATQYCNGWNDAGGYWLNYVKELEARKLTVKLPTRATAEKFIDIFFDNNDLAGVYNACRLECEVRLKDACCTAGFKLQIEE